MRYSGFNCRAARHVSIARAPELVDSGFSALECTINHIQNYFKIHDSLANIIENIHLGLIFVNIQTFVIIQKY